MRSLLNQEAPHPLGRGSSLMGEVKLTDTTSGKLCLSLLTSGVKFFPSLHSIAKCNDLDTTISDIYDFIKVRLIQIKEEGI